MRTPALLIAFISLISTSVTTTPNCNCVVFRLDDIQDWWIVPAQTAIMDVFKAELTPISPGIIANAFGDDDTIVNYMKSGLKKSGWDFNIVNHGWNHESFPTFTKAQQKSLLQQALTKTLNTLGSSGLTSITSFIPPFNDFNQDTIAVLKELGFTSFSSQVELDAAPYVYSNSDFYRWPEAAQTSNNQIEDYYIGVPAATTLAQIKAQIATNGFSVVMMHPQEFCILDSDHNPTDAIDTNQINQLKNLVAQVKAAGIKITTLDKLKDEFATSSSVATTGQSLTTGAKPLTSGAAPLTTGLKPITSGAQPLTTKPLTTQPLTTKPLTTQAATTKPLTSGVVPLTTGAKPLTTGVKPLTTGVAPLTTGLKPATTGLQQTATTGKLPNPPAPVNSGCNCIGFYLAEVQDYWQSDAAIQILTEFYNENVPLTIGVIPNSFGTESRLKTAVKSALDTCAWDAEVGACGYKYEAFAKMTLANQKTAMQNAVTKITQTLSVTPKVFIPPMLSFNANTLSAMQQTGFNVIAAYTDVDPAPYARATSTPVWHFPAGAGTYQAGSGAGMTATQTWTAVQTQLASQNYSVIMMTPTEFSGKNGAGLNSNMFTQLKALLALAKASGKELKLLSEMPSGWGGPASTALCSSAGREAKRVETETTNRKSLNVALVVILSVYGGITTIALGFVAFFAIRKKMSRGNLKRL